MRFGRDRLPGRNIFKRKGRKTVELLQLRENEKTVLELSGDLWEGLGQGSGVFQITDQRCAFRYKTLLGAAKQNAVEFELSEVAQIKKCNIGPGFIKFIPTGIKVTLKDGKKHVFSVTKREKMMQALGGN